MLSIVETNMKGEDECVSFYLQCLLKAAHSNFSQIRNSPIAKV